MRSPDHTKYRIFKYGGIWYSSCPHCAAVQRGQYWWQALEHMRIHAYEHPVDRGH